jgi:hypothetical protein
MDKKQALWGALKLRSNLAQTAILPAADVRATGALVGFDDPGLVAAVTSLSEENLVRLYWGGSVEVMEPTKEAGRAAVYHIYGGAGAVGDNAGQGATFDLRGSGQGGTYNEVDAPSVRLESMVAGLAAAAELSARAAAPPPPKRPRRSGPSPTKRAKSRARRRSARPTSPA